MVKKFVLLTGMIMLVGIAGCSGDKETVEKPVTLLSLQGFSGPKYVVEEESNEKQIDPDVYGDADSFTELDRTIERIAKKTQ